MSVTTIPSLKGLCTQVIKEHLQQDIAALQVHPRLSLDEARTYDSRQLYRKIFGNGKIFRNSVDRNLYLKYCNQVKTLRQNYLPLRASDAIRSGVKQSVDDRSVPIRKYVSIIKQTPKKGEALRKQETEFLKLTQEHEEAICLASKISCLHGTNSSLFALIDLSDYTLCSTGQLLDRGIAVMSGEISKGGMIRNGVNQRCISCDTIEGISRCWKYASKKSHSFTPPNEKQFFDQFKKGLEALKAEYPDSDEWDPCLVSFLQLKQWNFDLFRKLCKENQNEIETIQKQCLAKGSEMEIRVLNAVDYPLEKLKQAATNKELRKQISREFTNPGYSSEFDDVYNYIPDEDESSELWFLKKICINKTLDVFNPAGSAIHGCIRNIFQFRINAEQELANYAHYREKLAGLTSTNREEVFNQLNSSIPAFGSRSVDFLETMRFILKQIEPHLENVSRPLTAEKVLKKTIRDKVAIRIRQNIKPFEKRYQRFLQIFSPEAPVVKIDDVRQKFLTNPYPLLLGSTKIKPIKYLSEYLFSQAKLGSEMDVFFVPAENLKMTRDWLETHHLEKQVSVYPTSLIEELQGLPMPLVHSSTQVIDFAQSITADQQITLNAQLNQYVFPLYAEPYSDGSDRIHHGGPHAARAVLFSICLMELYHAEGKKIKTKTGNLQIAVGSHDCERQQDGGEDLWDKESGEMCTSILKQLGQDGEAEFLGRCVAEKDTPTEDLEQRNVHDSDCLEINRCLYDTNEFDADKLYALKDLGGETVYPFIKEAQEFIMFTERLSVKRFITKSKEPYKVLLQILNIIKVRFPLMYSLNRSGIDALSGPVQFILTEDVESSCYDFIEENSLKVRKKERKGQELLAL